MTLEQFTQLIASVTAQLQGKLLDASLERELNASIPAHGSKVREIEAACRDAIQSGWMCTREAGGIRYGRVIKPGPATHQFSVDVVDMDNVVGPHHAHPRGEIDLILPITPGAVFDGQGAGWRVYGPNSSHRPTVTHGRALILYLLPEGNIEFTKN